MLFPNELTLSNANFLGLIFGTLSAVFFALEILLKKKLRKFYKADIIVVPYLLISVILLTPFISFGNILTINTSGLFILLASGVVASALGITLFTSGLKYVKAQQASIISYLEPLGAILWGLLIIAEVPTIYTLIGGVFILSGTYLTIKYKNL